MGTDNILDLVRAWADAALRGDADTLDTLLAADFVGVGPRRATVSSHERDH